MTSVTCQSGQGTKPLSPQSTQVTKGNWGKLQAGEVIFPREVKLLCYDGLYFQKPQSKINPSSWSWCFHPVPRMRKVTPAHLARIFFSDSWSLGVCPFSSQFNTLSRGLGKCWKGWHCLLFSAGLIWEVYHSFCVLSLFEGRKESGTERKMGVGQRRAWLPREIFFSLSLNLRLPQPLPPLSLVLRKAILGLCLMLLIWTHFESVFSTSKTL